MLIHQNYRCVSKCLSGMRGAFLLISVLDKECLFLSLPSSINELTWTIASRFLYLSQWRPSNRIVHIHRHSFEREKEQEGWSMQQSKNGEWSLMSCLVDVWPYELSFDSIDLSQHVNVSAAVGLMTVDVKRLKSSFVIYQI